MREVIWGVGDYFQVGGKRYDMNAEVVEPPDEGVPLVWNFNYEKPPVGRVEDIRVEDGELTGEVVFLGKDALDDEMWETIKRDFRLGGHFAGVKYKHEKSTVVTECSIKAVSIVLKSQVPNTKEENAAGSTERASAEGSGPAG